MITKCRPFIEGYQTGYNIINLHAESELAVLHNKNEVMGYELGLQSILHDQVSRVWGGVSPADPPSTHT